MKHLCIEMNVVSGRTLSFSDWWFVQMSCPGKNNRHVLLGTRYPVWKSETKYRTKIKVVRFPSSWEIDSPHPSVGMDQSLRPQRKNVGVLLVCFIPIPPLSFKASRFFRHRSGFQIPSIGFQNSWVWGNFVPWDSIPILWRTQTLRCLDDMAEARLEAHEVIPKWLLKFSRLGPPIAGWDKLELQPLSLGCLDEP